MNELIITDIAANDAAENAEIFISYSGSEKIYAWLEDRNKHFPYIFSLSVDSDNRKIWINYQKLVDFLKKFAGHDFKLSVCTDRTRIDYSVPNRFKVWSSRDILVALEKNIVVFSAKEVCREKIVDDIEILEIRHENKPALEKIKKLPVDILCIGSCFSRSIFKSDEYFNPTYKKYFNVKKTLFHNSLISLFSDFIAYDYSKIEDLVTGDAGKYIDVEFKKDLRNLLRLSGCQIIVVDNYVDATRPVVRINDNSYLTYNKYFSESIFKRFFSECEIVCPGTKVHLDLYEKSAAKFRALIDECHIKNVILIGGRLSRYKIDEETSQTDLWNDKMNWILTTNQNWDAADKIFLQEIPSAIYLDKRRTVWKSDVHSPIFGGASPSHYQRGYYKEIFAELIELLGEDLQNGR